MLALELEASGSEIEDQTYIKSSSHEIVNELSFVLARYGCRCLVLDNDSPFDDDVRDEYPDSPSFIDDVERFLRLDLEASHPEFMHERSFIDGLEKARSQAPMDAHRATNDGPRQVRIDEVFVRTTLSEILHRTPPDARHCKLQATYEYALICVVL